MWRRCEVCLQKLIDCACFQSFLCRSYECSYIYVSLMKENSKQIKSNIIYLRYFTLFPIHILHGNAFCKIHGQLYVPAFSPYRFSTFLKSKALFLHIKLSSKDQAILRNNIFILSFNGMGTVTGAIAADNRFLSMPKSCCIENYSIKTIVESKEMAQYFELLE